MFSYIYIFLDRYWLNKRYRSSLFNIDDVEGSKLGPDIVIEFSWIIVTREFWIVDIGVEKFLSFNIYNIVII